MNSLLLVEDDPVIGQEIVDFLTKHGFDVELAKNFAEGQAASNQAYDLAILDLNLPDGNGFDLYLAEEMIKDADTRRSEGSASSSSRSFVGFG